MPYLGTQPNNVKQNTGLYTPSEILQLTKDGSWGGSLELIQEQTVSNVATCNFTNIQGANYDVHLLQIENMFGATDNEATYLRFSNDSGSSFESSGYQYAFQNGRVDGIFETHASTSTSAINLTNNAGNGTNESTNLYCYIYNANNSSKYTFSTHQGTFFYQSATAMTMAFGGGVYPTAETINGFQILKDSGNITSAKISLYGVKQIWVT